MKFFKTFFIAITASLFAVSLQSADINIATLDPQAALFSTNVAKKELEELENSDEWKEVVEELQAKATEARDIQEVLAAGLFKALFDLFVDLFQGLDRILQHHLALD